MKPPALAFTDYSNPLSYLVKHRMDRLIGRQRIAGVHHYGPYKPELLKYLVGGT